MRAIIQRVRYARVQVDGQIIGEIGPGIMTLLGVAQGDTEEDLDWMIQKIIKLRVFEDQSGKMNLSLQDLKADGKNCGHLIVSQFTLFGDCRKGNRPSFMGAGPLDLAQDLYQKALAKSAAAGIKTAGGRFQADMKVALENDGPVTLWLESPRAAEQAAAE